MTIYAFSSGHDPKTGTAQLGMHLRDYFAREFVTHLIGKLSSFPYDEEYRDSVCKQAYVWADAMMKAREL